jgi:hypothetical protein
VRRARSEAIERAKRSAPLNISQRRRSLERQEREVTAASNSLAGLRNGTRLHARFPGSGLNRHRRASVHACFAIRTRLAGRLHTSLPVRSPSVRGDYDRQRVLRTIEVAPSAQIIAQPFDNVLPISTGFPFQRSQDRCCQCYGLFAEESRPALNHLEAITCLQIAIRRTLLRVLGQSTVGEYRKYGNHCKNLQPSHVSPLSRQNPHDTACRSPSMKGSPDGK